MFSGALADPAPDWCRGAKKARTDGDDMHSQNPSPALISLKRRVNENFIKRILSNSMRSWSVILPLVNDSLSLQQQYMG
jgi:hypothetical protein